MVKVRVSGCRIYYVCEKSLIFLPFLLISFLFSSMAPKTPQKERDELLHGLV